MSSTATLALLVLLLLSSSSPRSLAILNPVDYLALQSLRKSLSDLPGSSFLAAWDFTGDPCAFPGVLCSAAGHVSALALGDPRAGSPGLAGCLDPRALARLSALAELSLVPGRVAGLVPSPLPPNLRFLALSSNLLSGPIPPSLSSLRRLRTLDLSSNRLSGRIPPPISSLPLIANLILARNRLSGPIPNFPPSSHLLRLDFSRNALSGSLPDDLPPSLRYLSLSSNALSGHLPVLNRLNSLSYLDLSSNRLSGPIPGSVFALPISDLRLQRNELSGEVRPAGGALAAAMRRVDLSHNRLEGEVPAALAAAEVVYLNENRFGGEVPAAFAERVMEGGMRVLFLQRNFLTGVSGIGPASEVPAGTLVCLHYNCMVTPATAASACPQRAGRRRTRPAKECPRWRKG